MKPLQERKKLFMWEIWETGKDKYSKEMLRAFYDYFSEHNEPIRSNSKMLWEKQKQKKGVWNLRMRLAQWNSRGWDKKVTQNEEKLPDYYNKRFMAKLTGQDQMVYKKHLIDLGFKFNTSPGGSFIQTPDNKRIWL